MKPEYNDGEVVLSVDVIPSKVQIKFPNDHHFNRGIIQLLAQSGYKIIICSHGAGGKDYLKGQLIERGLKPEVSYTTRPMRDGETPGKTYHYIDTEKFLDMVNNDEFIQYKEFNKWFYGTPKIEFERAQLFIMSPPGIEDLVKAGVRDRCVVVYINIDRNVREERLEARQDADNPNRRLTADDAMFENFTDWNIQITNPFF